MDWYEPYGWLAAVVFVPWFLVCVLQVGRTRDLSRAETAVGIVLGAVVVMTFYYPLFIGAIALVMLLACRRLADRRGARARPMFPHRTLVVLGGTAVLSAVYWLPLLVSVLTTPGAEATRTATSTPRSSTCRFRSSTFDLVGVVMLFGPRLHRS